MPVEPGLPAPCFSAMTVFLSAARKRWLASASAESRLLRVSNWTKWPRSMNDGGTDSPKMLVYACALLRAFATARGSTFCSEWDSLFKLSMSAGKVCRSIAVSVTSCPISLATSGALGALLEPLPNNASSGEPRLPTNSSAGLIVDDPLIVLDVGLDDRFRQIAARHGGIRLQRIQKARVRPTERRLRLLGDHRVSAWGATASKTSIWLIRQASRPTNSNLSMPVWVRAAPSA